VSPEFWLRLGLTSICTLGRASHVYGPDTIRDVSARARPPSSGRVTRPDAKPVPFPVGFSRRSTTATLRAEAAIAAGG
jgi:hypothetical protein